MEYRFDSESGHIIERTLRTHLLDHGEVIHPKKWQATDLDVGMFEVFNTSIVYDIPKCQKERIDLSRIVKDIQPDLPWADEHFKERVSGVPMNPAPSYKIWPYYKYGENWETDTEEHTFTHTYPERFWTPPYRGIRYEYGNLADLIDLLVKEPDTRQAFLPMWFPEDTGALNGRVPCTIGYHFYIRDGKLNMYYPMRSCDLMRHFKNDLYMAIRMMGYIMEELDIETNGKLDLLPGKIHMQMWNLHVFEHEKVFLGGM